MNSDHDVPKTPREDIEMEAETAEEEGTEDPAAGELEDTTFDDGLPEGSCFVFSLCFICNCLEMKIQEGDSHEVVKHKLKLRDEWSQSSQQSIVPPTTIATGPPRPTTPVLQSQELEEDSSSSTFIPDSQPQVNSSTSSLKSKKQLFLKARTSSGSRKDLLPIDTVNLDRRSSSPSLPRPQLRINQSVPSSSSKRSSSTAKKAPRPEFTPSTSSSSSSSSSQSSLFHDSPPSKTLRPPFPMSLGEEEGSATSIELDSGGTSQGDEEPASQQTDPFVAENFQDEHEIQPPAEIPRQKESESSK